jgi:dihydropteroate synthase
MKSTFLCGRFRLELERPLVMGIVNVTPDSFSDGAEHFATDQAIAHAQKLVEQGADILDIGGESTRPGAEPVPVHEELRRVVPVIRHLQGLGVPLSVDTFKPDVMRAALDAGADMINDIYGLRLPGAVDAVAGYSCGVCVMHMQGEPKTMQQAPMHGDVMAQVGRFLSERVAVLRTAGVGSERIVLDPGLGFGKTPEQNYQLLRDFPSMAIDGLPWLIGVSRKSMIGHIVNKDPKGRLAGSLAAALAGVARGAAIVRVHDVEETVDALRVWAAVQQGGRDG